MAPDLLPETTSAYVDAWPRDLSDPGNVHKADTRLAELRPPCEWHRPGNQHNPTWSGLPRRTSDQRWSISVRAGIDNLDIEHDPVVELKLGYAPSPDVKAFERRLRRVNPRQVEHQFGSHELHHLTTGL
ncbi:MAG: hypothetical protein IPF88_08050 [Candidatus Microthrix sp.]|nr:hypothetical protein [Candidatus Microthrix sp.]MBK6438535.1 hypothetical protein [Candidatus Microthrix sp.]